jgi:hypothetical protein
MIIFIPKKYYKYLKYINYTPNSGHNQWLYLIKNTDLTYKCLDTMIHTRHNPNTQDECNPLYYIVNLQLFLLYYTAAFASNVDGTGHTAQIPQRR